MSFPAAGAPQELKNMVAGVEPLAPEDFALRREKARRLLAENGLDAVFIGGGTNLLFFTKVGWWLSERVFGVVLSQKRDPIWVCPAFEVKRAEELVPAGQEIRTWEEHENPYAVVGGPQFGPNTAFPHGSQVPRTLTASDAVLVDGGCSIEGYRSDVTRTVVFGKPSDKQRRVWDIVRKAQAAALEAARPGATCESVDRAARKVVEDAGFGPGYKYFAHRLGHGIGMEGHEYPYLVKGNMLKLEPGMTFSNEPGIYIYGEFGIRIEDCMVVTETGARHLGGLEAVSIEEPIGPA